MAIDLRCLFDFRHFKQSCVFFSPDAKIMVDVRPVSNEGTRTSEPNEVKIRGAR
jgi:hypothetical protein